MDLLIYITKYCNKQTVIDFNYTLIKMIIKTYMYPLKLKPLLIILTTIHGIILT